VNQVKIDKETRKMLGILIEWYLTGELDNRIESERIEAKEAPTAQTTDKSIVLNSGGSGSYSSGFGIGVVFNPRATARRRYKMLKLAKKKLELAMDSAKKNAKYSEHRKILFLFYKHDHKINQIAQKLGWAEDTIKKRKRDIIDYIADHMKIAS